MYTPKIVDGRESHKNMKYLKETEARKKLEQVKKKDVSFAIRALLPYNGCLDNDVPVPQKAVSFQKYDDDWWIGRLVINGSPLGFVPTPSKFQEIRTRRFKILQRGLKKTNSSSSIEKPSVKGKSGQVLQNQAVYYDIVPVMRPVCLIGPSLKGYYILRKLIKSNEKCTVHEIKAQLSYAESLLRLEENTFDLVLKENELSKVVKEIFLFLNTYWKATHPDWNEIEKNLLITPKSKVSFCEPY
uniref:SH3 domain-containing protein n=1 Tax=Parastrongyloides trichosuri TaxID=131310 RepID=A0A0N5A1G1_PARTI